MVKMACLPMRGNPPPPTQCTRELDSKGLKYARPDLADAPTRGARPGEPPPDTDHCQIDTPVLLSSPLHGVDYREHGQRHAEHLLVACRFAHALEKFSKLLATLDVVEVEHVGTYNCRGVAGTRSLSGHGHALAIDVVGFERASRHPVSVEEHWNIPGSEQGRFLRMLAKRLKDDKIFDVVLTPGSGKSHEGHLHLEIRRK
jgi:hypothetical protein